MLSREPFEPGRQEDETTSSHKVEGDQARGAERPLRFAMASRNVAAAMLAMFVASSAAPAVAASAEPKVTIKLPPSPGGEENGEDDGAPGEVVDETSPDPEDVGKPPAPPAPPAPPEPPAEPLPPNVTSGEADPAPVTTPEPTPAPAAPVPTPAPTVEPVVTPEPTVTGTNAAPAVTPVAPVETPAPAPATPAAPAPPVAPAPSAPAPAPSTAVPAPTTPPSPEPAGDVRGESKTSDRAKPERRNRKRSTQGENEAAGGTPRSAPGGEAPQVDGGAGVASTDRPRVRVSSSQLARYSGRRHIVVLGESLWSIASDELGSRASDADIAAYVAELWELNRERIASGTPDKINVGVALRLPAIKEAR